MNVIYRGTGYMPDGTRLYIEDWTPEKCFYHPYVVAAFPISKQTLPGTWSPDFGRKFRYGMTFETFKEAAECADKLMHGEATLIDYADCIERPEYAVCVR